MYTPKISDDLVKDLYQISSSLNQPMTQTVDEIIRNYVHVYKKHNQISPTALKSLLEFYLEDGDEFKNAPDS